MVKPAGFQTEEALQEPRVGVGGTPMVPLFAVSLPPRTVVISLQKPSLHVSSHVVCPQSTLPEHLSFLGSQAGTEGSCGLGW